MADETIHIPPFPPLTWDNGDWTGEVTLPSWAGFQSRRGPYASLNSPGPSDGSVRIIVMTTDRASKSPPTPEQIAAYEHLLADEARVAAEVAHGLVEYYLSIRDEFEGFSDEADEYQDDPDEDDEADEDLQDDDEDEDEEESSRDVVDLRTLVGLSCAFILDVARDGVAYVGFEFGCAWDPEHGVGVMTHQGRVIEVGEAADAFNGSIAERDAKTM